MTRPKHKRDNNYYLERLRNEHTDVHTDFEAGRFKNLSEALVKAGMRKKRTSLDMLKAAWGKASTAERDTFKAFIGCAAPAATSAPASTPVHVKSPNRTTTGKRHLPPALKAAVSEIMKRWDLKNGDVMREVGRSPLDASLGMALIRDTQVQDSMIEDLEAWAAKNKAP
ncbi:hypothetical protein SAMN04490248_13317 [Salinihabitans flavidus]|uniref:Uncharacterized protein n=1 Tax=Salinihabitans flavidus TaxID=569882 RepID=A0A1H8VSB3_9RHOB|nr:hypothetical protein [Salinihabitans flavidus]SEP18173.1 hypothetical protein SAMN04490248_13317 [Salinihabitans flavidus]